MKTPDLSRFVSLLLALGCLTLDAAELRVPAFTAYTLPDPEGARTSERSGVTRWTNPAVTVNWYGRFTNTGEVSAKVVLRLPEGAPSRLQLTVGEAAREVRVTRLGGTSQVTADFGACSIARTGYQRFQLASLNLPGTPFGDLEALLLSGPAVEAVHFNLKERRNAASVHLS